jgi:hypothetical protein
MRAGFLRRRLRNSISNRSNQSQSSQQISAWQPGLLLALMCGAPQCINDSGGFTLCRSSGHTAATIA